jgi:hypothetical protein
MTTDKLDPAFDETELAATHAAHATAKPDKEEDDSTDVSSCCRGMSCRKKIIIGVAAALVLIAVIVACTRCFRKCGCQDKG